MTREEIINKIVKLWNEKKTSGEIAKEMNLTRNAVMGVVHRHGKRKTPLKIIRRVEPKPKIVAAKVEKKKANKKPEEKLTVFKKQIKVTEPFAEMKFKKTKGKKMLELGPFDCRWIWDDKIGRAHV